ncbi:MAG: hypothetical protein ACYDCI_15530, partial [Candidatus Limnocylindrales bacterium]
LGIPTGAALLVVIRARPPGSREVRLTVTPDSVPRRRSATLAGDPFSGDDAGTAHGGPADIEWHGGPSERSRPDAPDTPPALRLPGTPSHPARVATVERRGEMDAFIRTPVRSSVGLAVESGIDPMLAVLRRDRAVTADVRVDRRGTATPASSGIAILEAAVKDRADSRTTAAVAEGTRPDRRIASGPTVRRAADADDQSPTPIAPPVAVASCADERRAVDERCGLAVRLAQGAEAPAIALRAAQREYDEHAARADAAAAIADIRAQRTAKDDAQRAFREARSSASSREGVEAAARAWLHEINRINTTAHEAAVELNRERAGAVALIASIERLTLEADSARIQAEAAAAACQDAREALAACEEAASSATPPRLPPADRPSRPSAEPRPGPAAGTELPSAATSGDPAILRLLGGDGATLDRVAAALAQGDPDEEGRWRIGLLGLVDAIGGRAVEACAFIFPDDHPFWGYFTSAQARDVALALSSLGFRSDGAGGFADERVPGQRELSLALGYAGLDPMRIRRWPTEAELPHLYREVGVAADEYIAGAAPALTLGELLTLLGRRADGLTDLWNAWGRIRPLLLERT